MKRNLANYFTTDTKLLERLDTELTHIKTLAQLRGYAYMLKQRAVGQLLVSRIDRLTGRKIKTDGSRDGRWAWENSQAGVGRRIRNENQLLNANIICGIESLVVRDYKPDEPWGLIRNWRNRLVFVLKRNPRKPHGMVLDILQLALEHLS